MFKTKKVHVLITCLVLSGLLLLSAYDLVTKDDENARLALKEINISDTLLEIINNAHEDFLVRKEAFDLLKEKAAYNNEASLALEQIKEEIKNIFAGKRGLYALWYGGNHDPYLTQPYISGGQLFYQWGNLEVGKGQYDFSELADDLEEYSEMGIYTTLQINGNNKPKWLYNEVPYHPEKFSGQIRDNEGSLMYWHPTYIDAHINFLEALGNFIKENEHSGQILGIRQNFNAFGTEHMGVPEENRDLDQWIIPDGVDNSIRLEEFTRTIANNYSEIVLDNYIELLADEIKVFVRTNIDEELKSKYQQQFESGKLSWFHTSSEVEPRSGANWAIQRYQRFYDYARTGKTDAFAEPWASSFGWAGGTKSDRWCSPPKWNYWRLLFDLHTGVSYIGIYSYDMRVAIEGIYKRNNGTYEDGTYYNDNVHGDGYYQEEFREAFEFAAKYAGHQAQAQYSPGAWIAFRENDVILAENNMSEDSRRLDSFNSDYTFLIERLPDNSRGQGVINIGPEWQRYGAWARILPSKEEMNVKINEEFLQSSEGKELRIKVIYYDGEGEEFDILINGNSYPVEIRGEDLWKIKEIEIDDGILEENDKDAHIKIKAGSGDIYLHMVKIVKVI